MLTVINEDGTCSREYTFKTTQQWLAASADEDYDSIIDKSWERTWSVQGTDSVRYPVPLTEAQLDSMQEQDLNKPLGNMLLVHAKKTYDSGEEMSAELYRSESHHLKKVEGIKATSTLEKSFKWFYTDYTFSETFTCEDTALFPIPLSDFMSADTASFWFTGQPDLTQYLSGAEQKELLDKNNTPQLTLTLFDIYGGSNYVPGMQTYDVIYGGPGFGFSFATGLKLVVNKYVSLDPTFYGCMSRLNLPVYDLKSKSVVENPFTFNYGVMLRVVMNDFFFHNR